MGLGAWVESQLAAGSGGAAGVLLLVLAGLLASLLPCVYPLYPITATVVRQRSGSGPAWPHPVAYYAGLALAYGFMGVLAGLFGGAFNTVLRYAVTQLTIGGVLVVLAIATLGWIHLPIFKPRASNVSSGLFGTAVLGAGAGLLSSACVGPVVVGLLVKLASDTDAVTLSPVGAAAASKLAFGAGVGLPFLAIGLFGLKLPRSGAWMQTVQVALAGVLVWFAGSYLHNGLVLYGLEPREATSALTAAAAAVGFAYYVQNSATDIGLRITRSLAAVGLIACAAVLFREIGPKPATPSSPVAAAPEIPMERRAGLEWHLDPERAYAEAKATGRSVFIDFYGSWCTNCKAFEELTATDEALNRALQNAVLLKVVDTTPAFETYKNDPRFPELKVGLPFFVITDTDGNLIYKTSDYTRTEEMALLLE